MTSSKIINFIQSILTMLFIGLFGVFSVYIYKDNIETEQVMELVDWQEKQLQIEPVTIKEEPKIEQEKEVLKIEPPTTVINQEKNNEKENINSKFYYNQLDKYSKLIYTSLCEQKESLKDGTSIINLPTELRKILEEYEETNFEAVFTVAINAFEYDNPDIFYIDTSKLTLYYERDGLGNYKIYLKNDDNSSNYLINGLNSKQDVEQAIINVETTVQEIQNGMQGLTSDYQKLLYVHDWIVENAKYDETLNKANKNNIYGAFIEKEITCGGYAKAFKYIIDKLNINCIIIQGIATTEEKTENHAWNYVELENTWYGVDCTWDDPIIIGGHSNNEKYQTYFLKGKNEFINHKPFDTFYGTNLKLTYPELK